MTLQPCNVWLQNIVIIEVKNAMLGQVGTAFFVLSFQVSRLRLINDIQIYNDWSCWGTWPRLAWSWSTPMTTILIILQPGTLLISCTIRTVITTHQRLWILQDKKLRHELVLSWQSIKIFFSVNGHIYPES